MKYGEIKQAIMKDCVEVISPPEKKDHCKINQ